MNIVELHQQRNPDWNIDPESHDIFVLSKDGRFRWSKGNFKARTSPDQENTVHTVKESYFEGIAESVLRGADKIEAVQTESKTHHVFTIYSRRSIGKQQSYSEYMHIDRAISVCVPKGDSESYDRLVQLMNGYAPDRYATKLEQQSARVHIRRVKDSIRAGVAEQARVETGGPIIQIQVDQSSTQTSAEQKSAVYTKERYGDAHGGTVSIPVDHVYSSAAVGAPVSSMTMPSSTREHVSSSRPRAVSNTTGAVSLSLSDNQFVEQSRDGIAEVIDVLEEKSNSSYVVHSARSKRVVLFFRDFAREMLHTGNRKQTVLRRRKLFIQMMERLLVTSKGVYADTVKQLWRSMNDSLSKVLSKEQSYGQYAAQRVRLDGWVPFASKGVSKTKGSTPDALSWEERAQKIKDAMQERSVQKRVRQEKVVPRPGRVTNQAIQQRAMPALEKERGGIRGMIGGLKSKFSSMIKKVRDAGKQGSVPYHSI